ncbi:MAG: tetratricopeptide repeat protein [Myxococcota bacterium]
MHGARLALEVLDDDDPRVGQCLAAIAVASSGDTSAFGAATEALCDWLARTNDPTWAAHGPFLRGWACLFDGRLDEAREHLHASLAHGPGAPLYGHVHRALGEVAVQQGRLDEAVAHGTHAVQSAHPSESQLARLDLAWALGAASRIPEAREVLASAEPLLQPSHRPTAFQVRGDLDRWAGALDDATVAYAEAQRWASHLGLSQSAHRTNRLLLDHERGDPGLPDALSAVLDEPAAWIQGPLRALAVRATVSTGGVLFERALTGLESDGLVWDPDAVRLLREARRHGTSAQAARIGAVLGPWDR